MTDSDSLRRRLVGQSAWVLIGQGLSAIGTLVGLRLVTGAVSPTVYGTVVLTVGVVALAQGVAVGPMMQAVLRFYPQYERDGTGSVLRATVTRTLRQPVLWLSIVLVVALGVWSSQTGEGLMLGPLCAALFVVDMTRVVETTFLNAAGRQRAMAQLVAADAWLRPVFAVIVVRIAGASASAVLAGYAIGTALPVSVVHVMKSRRNASDKPLALSTSEVRQGGRRLWTYARPLMLIPLLGWVSGQGDRFIIGGLLGLESAGLYAAVYGLASRPFLMFGNAVELSLRQIYYSRVSRGDRTGQGRILRVWLGAVSAGGILLLGAVALLHRQVAGVLLAPEYRAFSSLMVWIAAGYLLFVIGGVVERVCYAVHDTSGVLIIQAGGAIAGILVTVPMVLGFGVKGAAWSVPIYFGIQLCLAIARAGHASRRPHIEGVS